jgi:hypothetical protein
MKNFLVALFLTALASIPVTASPVTWTLTGVTFDTNGTITGSFVWNADTSTVSSISIQISGGPAPLLDGTLTNASLSSFPVFAFEQSPVLNNPGMWLTPSNPLTDAGGSDSLGGLSFVGFCFASDCSVIGSDSSKGLNSLVTLSGSLVGTPVPATAPEPFSAALCFSGLAALITIKRKWTAA